MKSHPSANPFRLAMSPLTRTVYAGRLKPRGRAEPASDRTDVTNDFYDVLIQMAASHGGEFKITANGEPAYAVTVRAIK